MKTSVFIVYHDLDYNARSQEMLETAKLLSDRVILLSQSKPKMADDRVKCHVCPKTAASYFKFLHMAKRILNSTKPDFVLLHDNYTAPILKYIVKRKMNVPVIYDSSELYIDRKLNKPVQRIMHNYMENAEIDYLKNALISIAANEERAQIMTKEMHLERPTLVFDNMHRIDDPVDTVFCDKKYADILRSGKVNILYAGGLSPARRSFELAETVAKLGEGYNLIITGRNMTENGTEMLETILKKYGRHNVHYMDQIPRSELKYLLGKVDFSVSVFAQDTMNNIYCASGKLYESIFEGVPVLTSENPPLARLCREKHVGVSDNDFENGILTLTENLSEYKVAVHKYRKNIDYEGRVADLARRLSVYIDKYQRGEITL